MRPFPDRPGSVRRRARVPGISPVAAGAAVAGLAAGIAIAGLALPAHVLAHEVAGDLPTAVPGPLDAIADWSFDPTIQVPILLAALFYAWAFLRVRRDHPANPSPVSRLVLFLTGLFVIEYALQGPVDHYEAVLFSDHMIQHLLLMMVAAPFIAMSAPITLLLRVASPRVRARWILPILRSRLIRLATHPLVGSVVFAGVLWATHFSPVYELALTNPVVHDLEHITYLVAAFLFWWPLVGRDPSPWHVPHPIRLGAMLLQMFQGSFLGIAIMNAGKPLYPYYASIHLSYISTIGDQQLAGAIMWGGGGTVMLFAGLLVFYDWMGVEEKAAARIDARLDREEREHHTRGGRALPHPKRFAAPDRGGLGGPGRDGMAAQGLDVRAGPGRDAMARPTRETMAGREAPAGVRPQRPDRGP